MNAIAVWEEDGANITKVIRCKSDMKNAKIAGKKPNKLILGPKGIYGIKNSDLKKYVSYTGLIIQANADKPIYDGRNRKL